MRESLKKRCFVLMLLTLLITVSCLHRQFIKGRAELISVSDTLLSDSCLFTGYVFPVDFVGTYPYKAVPFEVWIESTALKTVTDSTGYYCIKTMPGTYTIKSQAKGNEFEALIEKMNPVKIEKNQKIRIDFYIGTAVE